MTGEMSDISAPLSERPAEEAMLFEKMLEHFRVLYPDRAEELCSRLLALASSSRLPSSAERSALRDQRGALMITMAIRPWRKASRR